MLNSNVDQAFQYPNILIGHITVFPDFAGKTGQEFFPANVHPKITASLSDSLFLPSRRVSGCRDLVKLLFGVCF